MAMVYQHDDKVMIERFLGLPYMACDLPFTQWMDMRRAFYDLAAKARR